jgi:endonuclease G
VFFEDARLPKNERATLEDYRGSGMDRGHNFPAGDAANSVTMAQSFSLANMLPQSQEMNRGAWSKIEQATRKYVLRASGNVYVYTGSVSIAGHCPIAPSNSRGDCTIGNGVVVPSHIYKLVYDATSHRAWAYWLENMDSARISPPISYEELVKRTGIEFLPNLHPKG